MPPLIECSVAGALPLAKLIKPPDADTLYEWMTVYGDSDGDPSWASVWPAAASLAARIHATPSLVSGKRVVELGSGLGVTGLTAAVAGAESVALIDREPLALHCALSTATCCGLTVGAIGDQSSNRDGGGGGLVGASCSDWGKFAEQSASLGGVDVVLAAEVLYDPAEAQPLAECVAQMLSERGGTLLLADPAQGRAVGCRARLHDALAAVGATSVTEEPLSRIDLDAAAEQSGAEEELVLLQAKWSVGGTNNKKARVY